MTNYKGQCLCGEVKYEFEGEPLNTYFCYCSSCQKMTSSDKYFSAWVRKDNLKILQGTPDTFTRIGDSGQPVHGKFCTHCHTLIYADTTALVSLISLAVSTITSPHDFKPTMAIYTSHAASWAVFPKGVPAFDTLPSDMRERVATLLS